MQDIRTIDKPLEIGRFYLVPHIKIRDDNHSAKSAYKGQWMPVLGDIHEDPEISKRLPLHIHPDWRFVSLKVKEYFGYRFSSLVIAKEEIEILAPVLKPSKMKREFKFPGDLCNKLEPIYLGKKTGCSVCPHRGIPLNGLTPDDKGFVICPGHGLKVHQETGLVVERFAISGEVS